MNDGWIGVRCLIELSNGTKWQMSVGIGRLSRAGTRPTQAFEGQPCSVGKVIDER